MNCSKKNRTFRPINIRQLGPITNILACNVRIKRGVVVYYSYFRGKHPFCELLPD